MTRLFRSIAFAFAIAAVCRPGLRAADQTVIFNFDDISDGDLPPDWTIGKQGALALGRWEVQGGELVVTGGGTEVWIWYEKPISGDITLDLKVTWPQTPAPDVGRHGGIAFFCNFPNNDVKGTRYDQMIGYTLDWIDRAGDHGFRCHKWANAAEQPIIPDLLFNDFAAGLGWNPANPPSKWRIEVRGDIFSILVNNPDDPDSEPELFQEVADASLRGGYLGLWQWSNNLECHYDDISITHPDLLAFRDIPDDLRNGGTGTVQIALTAFQPGPVEVTEVLPADLTASEPSNGGTVNGQTITWNLPDVNGEITLTYKLTADPIAHDSELSGKATLGGKLFPITGETAYAGAPFTKDGFIKVWNHLGPLAWAYPSVAGDHGDNFVKGACSTLEADPADPTGTVTIAVLSRDWIVNAAGSVSESNIVPFPGMMVRPNYGGDGIVPDGTGARAAGLTVAAGDQPPAGLVVRDRFPVWKGGFTRSDTINHANPEVNGFDAEDHVTLSCAYVVNNTGTEIVTQVGIGSDDSIQIFINDVDITAGDQGIMCRGWGAANEEQNQFPATLKPGENRVLVKVADGTGASGFRLRFQDPEGQPDPVTLVMPGLLPPKISVRLESEDVNHQSPGGAKRTLAKDTFAQGEAVPVTVEVDLKKASDVIVKETLPAGATAAAISDGGTVNGDTVQWNLTGVQKKLVSYQVTAPLCPPKLVLLQGSITVGANEVATTGADTATRVYGDDDLGVWTSRDIGATTGGAVEKLGDHDLLVKAVGAGITGTKDDFRFISIPVSGDTEISTRIDCIDDVNNRGLAGVMARNTDDIASANVFFGLVPGGTAGSVATLKASFRNDSGKSSRTITMTDNKVASLPIYLKLARTGARVSLQRSPDGVTYTEVAFRDIVNVNPGTNQVNLANDMMIGLAATGAAVDNSVRVNFVGVSGPSFGGVPPGKKFRRGDVDATSAIDINDPVLILGYLFLGAGTPQCLEAADTDDNGEVDITDAVNNLGYQFLGGPAPDAPGPINCGPDGSDPFLGCNQACP